MSPAAQAPVKTTDLLTAQQLKLLRVAMGLTQTEFAQLIGRTKISVFRWEHGLSPIVPYIDNLYRLVAIRHRMRWDTRNNLWVTHGRKGGAKALPKSKAPGRRRLLRPTAAVSVSA